MNFVITRRQERVGAQLALVHVTVALVALIHVTLALLAHVAMPRSLATRLGVVADPWFRRETGTANAGTAGTGTTGTGTAYGAFRLYRGHRDPTFLRSTGNATRTDGHGSH